MVDEVRGPESLGSEPSLAPGVSPASGASAWSRGGSPDFVVSPDHTADGSRPSPPTGELQPPRRGRRAASRWIIGAAAAIVVVVSAVLILQVARPRSEHATPAGTSVSDLRAYLIPIPTGLTPCRTDGQHYVAAQLDDSVVLSTGVGRRLGDAGLVDAASRCWVDASGIVFAVTLLRFEKPVGIDVAFDASLFAATAATKFVLPPTGGTPTGSDTQWSPGRDVPNLLGWKRKIMYLVGTVPTYSVDDSTLKRIAEQQLARL